MRLPRGIVGGARVGTIAAICDGRTDPGAAGIVAVAGSEPNDGQEDDGKYLDRLHWIGLKGPQSPTTTAAAGYRQGGVRS